MNKKTTQPFPSLDAASFDDSQIEQLRDQTVSQQAWTRQYCLQLLEDVPEKDWYVIPSGMTSHIAWQVGHLAVAQYGLMLFRQRGRAEGDIDLMPSWLRKQFGRGTQPMVYSDSAPSPQELLDRLNAIHQRAAVETKTLQAATLREPCDLPYCLFPTKLGALMMATVHEGIHAGQIGLLRRGLGLESIR